MRTLPLLAAGLLSACNGPETNFTQLVPIMSVSPEALDIGGVGLLYSGEGTIYIRNDGKEDLIVTPSFEGAPVFAMDLTEELSIPPGEEVLATVTFTPETYQTYIGRAIFDSNDEEHPRWVVPVTGEGIDLPTPDIDIAPARTVETTLPVGTFESLVLVDILNVGSAPLTIDFIGFTADSDPEFTIETPFLVGQSVPANSSVSLIAKYHTEVEEGHNATIVIQTNDPDEPETSVLLLGNGGGDFPKPEAIIDCPPEVLLAGPEWVHLSGAESTDPSGMYPLEYKWTVISRPAASDAEIPLDPDDVAEVDLYVDVAGTWQVDLVVTNQQGTESEPTSCVFEAYPEDDIHIELSWDTLSADLDLHLTQGGSNLFDVPEDCNYCNQNPDWGTNSSDDDPRLDIDDIGGLGPENINVFAPEDGTYDVSVHYFAEHGDEVVLATVKVWLSGIEIHNESRVMVYDEVWTVGQIAWPDSIFTNTGTPNTEATLRTCPE